jgi:hypothetical protein
MNFYKSLQVLAKTHGNARKDLHNPIKQQDALIEDKDPMGMLGEMAFALITGHAVDLEQRIEGDEGYDFIVPLKFTIDVKTTAKTEKSNNLMVQEGKVKADIYVLAMVENDMPDFVGWAWVNRLRLRLLETFARLSKSLHSHR